MENIEMIGREDAFVSSVLSFICDCDHFFADMRGDIYFSIEICILHHTIITA